jgi:hypothetical protein
VDPAVDDHLTQGHNLTAENLSLHISTAEQNQRDVVKSISMSSIYIL